MLGPHLQGRLDLATEHVAVVVHDLLGNRHVFVDARKHVSHRQPKRRLRSDRFLMGATVPERGFNCLILLTLF